MTSGDSPSSNDEATLHSSTESGLLGNAAEEGSRANSNDAEEAEGWLEAWTPDALRLIQEDNKDVQFVKRWLSNGEP